MFTFNWEVNLGNIFSAIAVLLTLCRMGLRWRDKMEAAIDRVAARAEKIHLEGLEAMRDLGEKVAKVEGQVEGIIERNGWR